MTILVAFLLAAAEPAAPSPPPSPSVQAADEALRADAMELARVLNPEGPMIEMAVANFGASMRSVMETSDEYRTLEKEYPGISEALVEAMIQAMRADLVAGMPALRRRYARFYAEQFSPGETAQLIGFYSSKAGQRLIAAKFSKLDAKPLMSEFAEAPDTQVSKQHIRDLNRAATNSILPEMSSEDRAALLEFAKQPVFIKLTKARGAFEQLEAEIANEPDPELDQALEAATNAVFLKFTGEPLPAK